MLQFTDTHTHLYASEFDADRKALLEKAIAGGVTRFYLPNIEAASVDAMLQLEKDYPQHCVAMMGLHPCSVGADVELELAQVRAWLEKRRFAAIGEIGMDLYWDKTFVQQQERAFRQQIDWALEFGYPIVIHCREAFTPIYEVLQSYQRLPRGIFHCFSGSLSQAREVIDLGFKLGIGGVVTFKNAGLDRVIADLGAEHLVLETDAPYLAPVPYRGKRNEPLYLLDIARRVAELCRLSLEELAKLTNRNADWVFNN